MTDRYALIGAPVQHSKSPLIHRSFAAASAQDLDYIAIESPLDGFIALVDAFRAQGGKGMNITTPFKLEACAYSHNRSERAERAGAANVFKFEGSKVLADNTDGIGLVRDIEHNLQRALKGQRVLLLGAGGAARGALWPLLSSQPALLVIANRSADKAQALVKAFNAGAGLQACGIDELGAHEFDIVINATSASLRAEQPALSPQAFTPHTLAYEMAYGRGLTPFLQLARSAGAQHLADGTGMLVEQAAEAFEWWRGVRPDTRAMIAQLTVPLV